MKNRSLRNSLKMLQCFWDLASLDSSVRIKATTSLSALLQSLEPADPESIQLSESSMPLDKAIEGCHPKVAYSLKRLCKGLASSRKAARQGFALALTALLQEIRYLNDDKIISLILQSFKYSSAHSTDRDVYFGHILGLGSIARIRTIGSGVCQELIEQALWLSGEKSFLRKAASK